MLKNSQCTLHDKNLCQSIQICYYVGMDNPPIYANLLNEDEVSRVISDLHIKPYLFSLKKAINHFKAGPLSLVSNRIVIGLTGSFDIHYLNIVFHLEKGDYLYLPEASLIYFESCEENSSIVSIDYESEKLDLTHELDQVIEQDVIFIKNMLHDAYYIDQFYAIDKAIKGKVTGSYILARTAVEKVKMMELDYRLHHRDNRLSYKGKMTQKENVCRICMQYIDDHISSPISIDELSQYSNYTPNYIYKAFRECLSTNTQHYIMIRRLYKSVRELRLTNDSIESIASRFGFSSVYHFSNAFKKEFGISPSYYRKKQQNQ